MNQTIQSTILVSVSSILFVAALTIGLLSINIEDKATKTAHQWVESQDHRVQTVIELKKNETYTGAQVLQMLYQNKQLDADIQIDDQTFSKTMNIENTDVSNIDAHKTYFVTYQRNKEGTLTKIIFKGGK
jgi:hypothetical protein